jgi:hypothetical protein
MLFTERANASRPSIAKRQLETLLKTRKYSREIIKGLPQPLWKPEEIQQQLDAEESEWGPQERELTETTNTGHDRYENRVVTLGAVGVLLLIVGFAVQLMWLIFQILNRT